MTVRVLLGLSTLLLVLLLASFTQVATSDRNLSDYLTGEPASLVAIAVTTEQTLQHFEESDLPLYARLAGQSGDTLITSAGPAVIKNLAAAGLRGQVLEPIRRDASYYVIYPTPGRPPIDWRQFGHVLLEDDRYLMLRIELQDAEKLTDAGYELAALTLEPKPIQPQTFADIFPEVVSPNPDIQSMIDQVISSTVSQYDGALSGEWPVIVGGLPYTIGTRYTFSGEPIQRATEYVGEHLEGLGLGVEYHQWEVQPYPPNVIGEIIGEARPEEVFIISAHLDDMPSGSLAPGADDNASGSTAVLIAADVFSQYRWDCTLRFAFWTGEEQGLWGSHAYAQRAFENGENIVGVLNLDMIGWNTPGSSPDMDLHARSSIPASLELAQLFADIVSVYDLNLIPELVSNGVGASDHASFWDYGYTAILGIEDYAGTGDFNPYYHTVHDRLTQLEMDYFTEIVRASLATTAHMADCLIPPGSLEGQVTVDGSSVPIDNALISIDHASGWQTTARSNDSGQYSVTLSAGNYTVAAMADGHVSSSDVVVEVMAGGITVQDFALMPEHFNYLPITIRRD